MMRARRGGFSLIELIVALTVSVVVVGFIATFITVPVRAHLAQARRARACLPLPRRLRARWPKTCARRCRAARAPYIDNGRVVLELIPVLGVVRYCDIVGADCPDRLDFAAADSQFDVARGFPERGGRLRGRDRQRSDRRGVGAGRLRAYEYVIAAAQDSTGHLVTLQAPPFLFLEPLAEQSRVPVVSDVTRYECDPNARTLRRFVNVALPAGVGPAPLRRAVRRDRARRHRLQIHVRPGASAAAATAERRPGRGARSRSHA